MKRMLKSAKWRDLLVAVIVTILVWFPLVELDAFEEVYQYSRSHENWELDEVLLLALLMPGPLAWYAIRRAREAARLARESAKMAEDLAHAQKVDSLGTLAGGLAHELNNQLQPVIGLSGLLQNQIPPEDPRRRQVDLILSGAMRSRDAVERVLNFVHREQEALVPIPMSTPMRTLMELLEIGCPSSVRLAIEIDEAIPAPNMSWPDVESIVMNLFSNAISAMEGTGGKLLVRLENVTDAALLEQGYVARLTVQDTGTGIAPGNLKKVFDPYYTSKDVGKGTGLGLWQVHRLVTDAGGSLEVESQLNQGTTFTLLFPAETPGTNGFKD